MAEENYLNDDLDNVFIDFVPDELVKGIINGTDPNLDLLHTEIEQNDDQEKSVPKITLKLSSDEVKKMSEDLWSKALQFLQNDKSYFIAKKEVICKREESLKVLISNVANKNYQQHYENITINIYKIIELCLPTTSLISEGRRLMWQKFYFYSTSGQCEADWEPLKLICTVTNFDALVYKISSKLLELLITANIESYLSAVESTQTTPEREKMDEREQNIVKYVAGFIAHSVTKFYKKKKDDGEKFIEAVKLWSVKGRQPKCFEFKNKWVNLQNRGGLVDVNDTVISGDLRHPWVTWDSNFLWGQKNDINYLLK